MHVPYFIIILYFVRSISANSFTVGSKWLFRKVKWKIRTEKVDSFKIVPKTADWPFEDTLPTDFRKKVKLKVKWDEEIEWEYYIHWKDEKGGVHESDPIISISPSYLPIYDREWKQIIPIVLAVGLGVLVALKFLKKRR